MLQTCSVQWSCFCGAAGSRGHSFALSAALLLTPITPGAASLSSTALPPLPNLLQTNRLDLSHILQHSQQHDCNDVLFRAQKSNVVKCCKVVQTEQRCRVDCRESGVKRRKGLRALTLRTSVRQGGWKPPRHERSSQPICKNSARAIQVMQCKAASRPKYRC